MLELGDRGIGLGAPRPQPNPRTPTTATNAKHKTQPKKQTKDTTLTHHANLVPRRRVGGVHHLQGHLLAAQHRLVHLGVAAGPQQPLLTTQMDDKPKVRVTIG